MKRKNREKKEIIRDILYTIKTIRNPVRTRVSQKSNTSSQLGREYINFLIDNDFIELKEFPKKKKRYKRNPKFFIIKQKGNDYLIEYAKLKNFREKFDLESL